MDYKPQDFSPGSCAYQSPNSSTYRAISQRFCSLVMPAPKGWEKLWERARLSAKLGDFTGISHGFPMGFPMAFPCYLQMPDARRIRVEITSTFSGSTIWGFPKHRDFLKWGYPNSWLVYNGKSNSIGKSIDIWGFPEMGVPLVIIHL